MAKQKENYLAKVLGQVLTNNVNTSDEEYEKILDAVAANYDKVNAKKGTKPSVEERRKRVQQNFYGTTINFLFQILSIVNDLYVKTEKNRLLLNEIGKKLGIEVENVKTADEKAMEAVEKFYAERNKAKKEN